MTKRSEPDVKSLKDYCQYHDERGGLSLFQYAELKMTPDLLIAFSKLFWPDFILHEECILWADRFSEQNFQEWKKKFRGDLTAVEQMCNHTHLDEGLLQHLPEMLSDDNLRYLKDILVEIWGAALRTKYPDRSIEIEASLDEISGDYIITFWQPREGQSGN